MELDNKKNHIIRCIQLGMDVYSAEIIAQCTVEEMDQLSNDEDFNNQILFYQKYQEQELLQQHKEASLIAGLKGNTHGFEWMLEKINPDKFGRNGSIDLNVPKGIEIYLPEKESAED